MNIKEFITCIKDARKRRQTLEKQLRATYEANRYYNIGFDSNGLAYITYQSERITTEDEPQENMLPKLRTLRKMYIENQLLS